MDEPNTTKNDSSSVTEYKLDHWKNLWHLLSLSEAAVGFRRARRTVLLHEFTILVRCGTFRK